MRSSIRAVGTMIAVIALALCVVAPSASAAVSSTYTGWGAVNAGNGTATWSTAYQWDAASRTWKSSWRWTHASVYISAWTSDWAWTWTSRTGWLAMRTTDLRTGCGLSDKLVPNCGALLGASPNSGSGTWTNDISAFERLTGRVDTAASTNDGLDIVHSYHLWKESFPTAEESAQAAQGKYLLINWKPAITRSAGGEVPWRSISAGTQNAVIDAECSKLKAFARPVMLAFHHEPEDQVGSAYGSAAEYAAAFRYVRSRCIADGATNVIWVWNVMGFSKWFPMYGQLYPGDAAVDWIAYDPYNVMGCTSWRSAESTIGSFYDWAHANGLGGKPMMLAEWGACDNVQKGNWFRDVTRLARANRFPDLKAYVYFNHPEWLVESNTDSLAAYRALSADSYFRVRG